ncbi:MAG: hypothetical protein AUH05_17675 [Ktedonobacter sp. 13_2_20CM_53_11]|nr:MAG: hypothetical protein AUH05_17675 [Ktedonobacter sp. 13_2_20CM_53_11]
MNRPGPLGAQTKHDGRKGHGNAGGDNPQQASETTGPWQRLPKYGSQGARGSKSRSFAGAIRASRNFPQAAYSMDCPGPLGARTKHDGRKGRGNAGWDTRSKHPKQPPTSCIAHRMWAGEPPTHNIV